MRPPRTILADTGSEAYLRLLDQLIRDGDRVSPRQQGTRELIGTTVWIKSLEDAHVLNTARIVNQGIMATETMQLLAGLSSLEQLDLVSKGRFSQFADAGRLRGAYGPRLHRQLTKVFGLLKQDPDTRQAVATIWRGTEHEQSSRDVPCTQSVQFLVRDGKLDMRVIMRSSDVYLGVPYDWVMFSRLGMVMAAALHLEPGSYTHVAGSQHLYDRDEESVRRVLDRDLLDEPRIPVPPPLTVNASHIASFGLSRLMAGVIVLDDPISHEMGDDVRWYQERVPVVDDAYLCVRCRYVLLRRLMADGRMCKECDARSHT